MACSLISGTETRDTEKTVAREICIVRASLHWKKACPSQPQRGTEDQPSSSYPLREGKVGGDKGHPIVSHLQFRFSLKRFSF